jgi:Flp pilus assembly pilin Flp
LSSSRRPRGIEETYRFSLLQNLTRRDEGATTIEHGLIALAAIAALLLVHTSLSSTSHNIATTL